MHEAAFTGYSRVQHPMTQDEFLREWRKLGPEIPMKDPTVPEYMPPKGVAKAVRQVLGLPVIAVGRMTDHRGIILYGLFKVA